MSTQDTPMGMDGIELTDKQLEALAGGKLSAEAVETCRELVYVAKEMRGWTKEQFVDEYSRRFASVVEPGEIAAIADEYWDTF